MIYDNTQSPYSVLDLGFDRSLTKILLGQQGAVDVPPEMMNVFTAGIAPRTLLSGELISSLEQQTGVLFNGKTDFDNTQTGYRLGIDISDSLVKFYIGTSSDYFNFDGVNITISGGLSAGSIDIGGSDATSFHVDVDGNMWLGAATFATASFRVSNAGAVTATSATITGALTTGAGSAINGTYIDSLNVNQLVAGTITSKAITLAISGGTGDVKIQAGKTDFTNTETGFILGMDDSDLDKPKFYIGNATDYFNFNGANTIFATSLANAITIDHGSNILLKEGGKLKLTTVTAPSDCTASLVTIAGNVDIGTHTYRVSFVNNSGETNLSPFGSNTVTVDANNRQVDLSAIPVSSSSSVTSRKIYRTTAGGGNYLLLTTIANNTATTYTDNIADANLGTESAINRENTSAGGILLDGSTHFRQTASSVYIGRLAGAAVTMAKNNTMVGNNAGNATTTGGGNNFFGVGAGESNTTGSGNVFIGGLAGGSTISGGNNVCVGTNAGFTMTTASGNVMLGDGAGYHETGSNKFFIDNAIRANEADGRAKALIYGVFASLASGQKLTINGLLNQSVSKTPASAAAAGTTGDIAWDASYIYVCTATNTWKRVGIATW